MTAAQAPVLLAVAGGVATITLNRPRAFNAFDSASKPAMLDALGAVASDAAVRAVVITGTGKAFCAGQDLKEHLGQMQAGDPVGDTVTEFFNPMVESVTQMRKPVIASVNGVAAGAGAGLALACDLRIAGRSAVLRTSFAQVGLSADSGLSYTLPRLIGLGRAMRMTLLDEPIDAETALAWGAVDQVVDDAQLPAETAAVAARLAGGPTAAYGWIKASFAAAATGDLAGALGFENRAQQACFASADHREALSAFIGKRPPMFTGR
jgi:2-(1,2-epoxy-1,2-dihydrophenyl)acetyl-CoA isomerase